VEHAPDTERAQQKSGLLGGGKGCGALNTANCQFFAGFGLRYQKEGTGFWNAGTGAMGIVEDISTFVATDAALHAIFRVIFMMGVALFSLSVFLKRERDQSQSRWLAHPARNPAKRACEIWFLAYGTFWISCFGYIIASQVYLQFTELGYMVVCGGLATPLLLQPILLPSITCDQGKPLLQRFSFKANVWIFIFGFIGNYWSEIFSPLSLTPFQLISAPIALLVRAHFRNIFSGKHSKIDTKM
jgi:hypothetical protein